MELSFPANHWRSTGISDCVRTFRDPVRYFEGKYHYIKNGDGREEPYDTARDPLEERDLAQTMTEPAREHFKATLETLLMNRQIQPITARSP